MITTKASLLGFDMVVTKRAAQIKIRGGGTGTFGKLRKGLD